MLSYEFLPVLETHVNAILYPVVIFRFKRREISCTILSEIWDGYLGFELFNQQGNLFTYYYYGGGLYKTDYDEVLVKKLPSIYHVTDSWENYEKMKSTIDLRFEDWKRLI